MTSPTVSFDRRGLSALAKQISAQTGLPHAKALGCIARAAGYTDGNALMATLKAAEQRINHTSSDAKAPSDKKALDTPKANPLAGLATAVPEEQAAGYLYTLHFPFISDDGELGECSLEEVLYEVTEGGAVGGYGEDYVLQRMPISREDLARLATRFGSTPDFFRCFAEDEDDAEV